MTFDPGSGVLARRFVGISCESYRVAENYPAAAALTHAQT
jgi:hypothetical protein